MREILFRGKTYDNEWVEGFYVNQFGAHEIYCLDDSDYETRHIYPSTVGQYTGLTDQNGKKIFEGDILQVRHFKNEESIICKVVLNPRTAAFEMWYDVVVGAYGGKATHQCRFVDVPNYDTLEIIGNIHDNPDSLGGDDN